MRRRRPTYVPSHESMEQRLLMAYGALMYDFGTDTSPVSPGFAQVTPASTFNSTLGYGWTSGSVTGIDRGPVDTPSLRDMNATSDATFSVNLPAGTYDVSFTTGDTSFVAHDQMEFSLQGSPVATLDARGGQLLVQTYRDIVVGSDQMLRLRLRDLGGVDPIATIQSLSITPKVTGLRAIRTDPASTVANVAERTTITFNNPVRSDGLKASNIKSFVGPNGPISGVSLVWGASNQWVFGFPAQRTLGTYTMTFDSNIIDANGRLIDQDGDGVTGEAVDDSFSFSFTLVPPPTMFDFGTTASPTAAGYAQVTPASTYSATMGFGWSSGTITATDLGSSVTSPLSRDLNATTDGVFRVDVPSGTYNVTLTMGDQVARDSMGIMMQDFLLDTVSTGAGQFVTRTYTVRVSGGQFKLGLRDLGGLDPLAVINSLQIQPTATLPTNFFVSPTGSDTANGSLATPWKTLARALDQVLPGDTINLRAGTYTGGVTITKSNITIQGYANEKATISVPWNDIKFGTCITFSATGGKLLNLELIGGYYYAVKFDLGQALIDNVRAHDTGRDVIKIVPGANDITIRRSQIYRSGLRESNADGIDNVGGDRMLVQDCIIYDIVGYGVFGKGGAVDTVIERNTIRNAAAGVYLGGFTGTEFFNTAVNPNYYESINGIVRDNTISNINYAGIGIAGAIGGQVYRNVLIDTSLVGQGAIYFVAVTHYALRAGDPNQTTTNERISLCNNIITRSLNSERPAIYMNENSYVGPISIDYNRYNNAGKPSIFWDFRWWPVDKGFRGTLDTWRVRIGGEANSTDSWLKI